MALSADVCPYCDSIVPFNKVGMAPETSQLVDHIEQEHKEEIPAPLPKPNTKGTYDEGQ